MFIIVTTIIHIGGLVEGGTQDPLDELAVDVVLSLGGSNTKINP